MAQKAAPELITAQLNHSIDASSHPTPAKPPSQGAQNTTQVPRSPSIPNSPHRVSNLFKDADSIVQDSIDPQLILAPDQASTLVNVFEQSLPVDEQPVQDSFQPEVSRQVESLKDTIAVQDSVEAQPIAVHSVKQNIAPKDFLQEYLDEDRLSYDKVVRERPVTQPPPDVPTPVIDATYATREFTEVVPGIVDNAHHASTPLNPSKTSRPNNSAATATTTPTMAPKNSTGKISTSAKNGSTTSKSKASRRNISKPDLEIPNKGVTSSLTLLQNIKAGGSIQTNLTEHVPDHSRNENAGPSFQDAVVKPTDKTQRKRQSQHQNPPKAQSSRQHASSEGTGEYDIPHSPGDKQAKPTKSTKSTKSSNGLSSKKTKGGALKKSPVKGRSKDHDDDDDEDYSAPKKSKPSSVSTSRNTRASTRAQTARAANNGGSEDPARENTTSAKARTPEHVQKGPSKSRGAVTERYEDFEDIVTHANSGGDLESNLNAQPQPQKLPVTRTAGPRHITDRAAGMMNKISSDRAIDPVDVKSKNASAGTPRYESTPAHEPLHKQGTTEKKPITIEDDTEEDTDDDSVDYDEPMNTVTTHREQGRPISPQSKEPAPKQLLASDLSSSAQHSPNQAGNANRELLAEERAARKPNLISFGDHGPKRQASLGKQKAAERLLKEDSTSGKEGHAFDTESHAGRQPSPITTSRQPGPISETSETTVAVLPTDADDTPHRDQFKGLASQKSGVLIGQSRKTIVRVEVAVANKPLPVSKPPEMARSKVVETKNLTPEHAQEDELARPEVSEYLRADFPPLPLSFPQLPPSILQDEVYGKHAEKASMPNAQASLQKTVGFDHKQLEQSLDGLRDLEVGSRSSNELRESREIASTKISKPSKAREPYTGQAPALASNRKRSPAETIHNDPVKRTRLSAQDSHDQAANGPLGDNHTSRKRSHITDGDIPIPYGEGLSRKNDEQRTIHGNPTANSISLPIFPQQLPNDLFSLTKITQRVQDAGNESLSEDTRALRHKALAVIPQAVAHVGSTLPTNHSKEPKNIGVAFATLQASLASSATKSLGFMDGLRQEIIPQLGNRSEDDGDGSPNEASATKDSTREDDADETLIGELSDEGEDSESGGSSDTDSNNQHESELTVWREGLKPHQAKIHDALSIIAHRLVSHLVDHETAIEDINNDYEKEGGMLIGRFRSENKKGLEFHYKLMEEMKKAIAEGYGEAIGIFRKDMAEVKRSREEHVKVVQRQVEVNERLKKIVDVYSRR